MSETILFGWKPEWQSGLAKAAEDLGLTWRMLPLHTVGPEGFAAVLPLSLADQAQVDSWRAQGRTVPALVAPAAARALCDDKLALNLRLIGLGFDQIVPSMPTLAEARQGSLPVIFKARHGAWGEGVRLVDSAKGLDRLAADLAAGAGFLQALVPGHEECALHLLRCQGRTVFRARVRYVMPGQGMVKGRHAAPVRQIWTMEDALMAEDVAGNMALWDRLADALGLSDGALCIDYRDTDAGPKLFEINPRLGGSLTGRARRFLRIYLEAVRG